MMRLPEWSKEILREGISGRSLTTFGVGGVVPVLLEPRNQEEAIRVFNFLKSENLPYRLIGNGSNIVLPDLGMGEIILVRLFFKETKPTLLFEGNIFELDSPYFRDIAVGEKVILDIPASVSMMNISRQVSELGLSGLEYSAGIPGTLGGAVRMNAGAHGAQLSDVIASCIVWDANLQRMETHINGETLNFTYRHCSLEEELVILSARLELIKRDPKEVKEKRSSALKYRKDTQPLSMPSAGSVFRNPSQELAAAKILEDLGCKGQRVGGVCLSEMHSNWIVRVSDEAKASDIRILVDDLKNTAQKNTGIMLKEEIIFW